MADSCSPARLDAAFERIEGSILPCLASMLESLIDAAGERSPSDPARLTAQLRRAAAELDELTRAVERSTPPPPRPAGVRIAAA